MYCEFDIFKKIGISLSLSLLGDYGNKFDYFEKSWAEYVNGFGNPLKVEFIWLENLFVDLTQCKVR